MFNYCGHLSPGWSFAYGWLWRGCVFVIHIRFFNRFDSGCNTEAVILVNKTVLIAEWVIAKRLILAVYDLYKATTQTSIIGIWRLVEEHCRASVSTDRRQQSALRSLHLRIDVLLWLLGDSDNSYWWLFLAVLQFWLFTNQAAWVFLLLLWVGLAFGHQIFRLLLVYDLIFWQNIYSSILFRWVLQFGHWAIHFFVQDLL